MYRANCNETIENCCFVLHLDGEIIAKTLNIHIKECVPPLSWWNEMEHTGILGFGVTYDCDEKLETNKEIKFISDTKLSLNNTCIIRKQFKGLTMMVYGNKSNRSS